MHRSELPEAGAATRRWSAAYYVAWARPPRRRRSAPATAKTRPKHQGGDAETVEPVRQSGAVLLECRGPAHRLNSVRHLAQQSTTYAATNVPVATAVALMHTKAARIAESAGWPLGA